jgi:hypothetical protein
MTATPEQAKNILQWGNRHREMLETNYPSQFVAYSATRLLAAGTDFNLVKAAAQEMGEPFLMDWMPHAIVDIDN